MTAKRLRARVLAEWRGLPETPFPRVEAARGVGDLMGKVMEGLGLRERLREEEVVRVWGEIVGAMLAQHSQPQRLTKGVLTVQVLQPTLKYELDRVWKSDILAKLKARFGARTVREVRFVIG